MFNTFKRRYAKLDWRHQETVWCTAALIAGILLITLWIGSAHYVKYYISEVAGCWVMASPLLLGVLGLVGWILRDIYKAWKPILTALLQDDTPEEPLTKDPLL